MKQLSIEEKAEAYDKVVNKLKGFIMQGVDPLITRADVQDFFPELGESEDESIRKHIISVLEDCWQTCKNIDYDSSRIQEDIAWLKKQHDPHVTDAEMKEVLRTEYEKGRADAIAEMQKEWSEEDKAMLKETLALIETVEDINKAEDGFLSVKMWLKSLKRRIGG